MSGSVNGRSPSIGSTADAAPAAVGEPSVDSAPAAAEARVAQQAEELAQAHRELDALAHAVAHDLRAPLRAITSYGLFLSGEYASVLDERGRGYLGRMLEASAQMDTLLDALLQFARAARTELRRRPVELSALALDVVRELNRAESSRPVAFTCAPGLPVVGDPRLLRVVLSVLLANAWKFTRHAATPHVEFGRWEHTGDPAFFLRDNGVGFDPRYASRLFGLFQRLHPAAEFEGTGIGLATAQRILHRHGGKIWAETTPHAGATFYFTLPEPPAR